MTYDVARGRGVSRRAFGLGILGVTVVGCQAEADDPQVTPTGASEGAAISGPTTSAPPVDRSEIAWGRLVEDRAQATDVLLEALEGGHTLWQSVRVAALDLVPDGDLPVLVDAVAARLPADGALELGWLLALQSPDFMRRHESAMRAADRWFRLPEDSRDGARSLVFLPAHHLVFAHEHVHPPMSLFDSPLEPPTPTWQPGGPPVGTGLVGGLVPGDCATCGRQLHLLLDLGTFSASAAQPLPRQLVTCGAFSCLWSDQFFQHGDGATPESVHPREFVPGEPDPEPLPALPVAVHPTASRWHFQDWGQANGMQNLNRLGGEGSWIQDAIHPDCPGCGEVMPLLAQFDSETRFVGGSDWASWTEGIIYCYWCLECRISATSKQQT
ncbi:hypothetical protein [Ornithinimicrobium cryptoxanthini]|uniref:DUF1963 domain-containing protein n=1 Tax=Ornithinimicrobium cryptoxanthini TaxID=2934161 RepID=A0ABY4YK88_9MICO|nr:hypothetical protein [Ornithinimicrobium cryptoxanthini]USQ77215.1 hypothetical protein NF557_04690 [Ornithinimicrobium cryptoxanthini]